MQSPMSQRSSQPQSPPVAPSPAFAAPRGERPAEENSRFAVALEPKWVAAIDAATD
jgi:hypothetical protein